MHWVLQYFVFAALWWATRCHPLELLDYKWATHFRRLCCCAASGSQIGAPNSEFWLGDAALPDDETRNTCQRQEFSSKWVWGVGEECSVLAAPQFTWVHCWGWKARESGPKPIKPTPCHWELFVLHYSRALPHGTAHSGPNWDFKCGGKTLPQI